MPDRSKSSDADSTKSIHLAENLNPKQILKKYLFRNKEAPLFPPMLTTNTGFMSTVNVFTSCRQTLLCKKKKKKKE